MLQMLVEKYLVQSETVYGTSIVVKKTMAVPIPKFSSRASRACPVGVTCSLDQVLVMPRCKCSKLTANNRITVNRNS